MEGGKKRTDFYNVYSLSSIQCIIKGSDFITLGPA